MYPNKANDSNLEKNINRFCERGQQEEFSTPVTLYDSITLAKNKYVLVELNAQLGVATLKKGISGDYKIDELGCGNRNFIEFVANNKEKNYVLFGGRNMSLQIAKVTFTLEG